MASVDWIYTKRTILILAIVLAIVSVSIYVYGTTTKYYWNYPSISLGVFFGGMIVFLIFIWLPGRARHRTESLAKSLGGTFVKTGDEELVSVVFNGLDIEAGFSQSLRRETTPSGHTYRFAASPRSPSNMPPIVIIIPGRPPNARYTAKLYFQRTFVDTGAFNLHVRKRSGALDKFQALIQSSPKVDPTPEVSKEELQQKFTDEFRTGDTEFDNEFQVFVTDQRKASEMLDFEVRRKILEFSHSLGVAGLREIMIDFGQVYFDASEPRAITNAADPNRARNGMALLSLLAERLRRSMK